MSEYEEAFARHGVSRVVCLADLDEARRLSPEYASLLEGGAFRWPIRAFAIPDYGVPDDRAAFATLVRAIADWLAAGERVVIHCAGGIGRSGTVATCVLVQLGYPIGEATARVESAGSHPETDEQRALVRWFAAERATAKGELE